MIKAILIWFARLRDVITESENVKLIFHLCGYSRDTMLNCILVEKIFFSGIIEISMTLALNIFPNGAFVCRASWENWTAAAALHLVSLLHTFLQQKGEPDFMSLIQQASKGFGALSQYSD